MSTLGVIGCRTKEQLKHACRRAKEIAKGSPPVIRMESYEWKSLHAMLLQDDTMMIALPELGYEYHPTTVFGVRLEVGWKPFVDHDSKNCLIDELLLFHPLDKDGEDIAERSLQRLSNYRLSIVGAKEDTMHPDNERSTPHPTGAPCSPMRLEAYQEDGHWHARLHVHTEFSAEGGNSSSKESVLNSLLQNVVGRVAEVVLQPPAGDPT